MTIPLCTMTPGRPKYRHSLTGDEIASQIQAWNPEAYRAISAALFEKSRTWNYAFEANIYGTLLRNGRASARRMVWLMLVVDYQRSTVEAGTLTDCAHTTILTAFRGFARFDPDAAQWSRVADPAMTANERRIARKTVRRDPVPLSGSVK